MNIFLYRMYDGHGKIAMTRSRRTKKSFIKNEREI